MIGSGSHAQVIADMGLCSPFVVAIGDNRKRKAAVAERGYVPYDIAIHPSAVVSKMATIGEGTVIMAGAVVQAHAVIGRHCIINTGATVDHHCVLQDFVHIAPGAHLCGNVSVGEGTLVGVGVGVGPNTAIPSWSLLKARRLEIEPLPSN